MVTGRMNVVVVMLCNMTTVLVGVRVQHYNSGQSGIGNLKIGKEILGMGGWLCYYICFTLKPGEFKDEIGTEFFLGPNKKSSIPFSFPLCEANVLKMLAVPEQIGLLLYVLLG